MAVETRVPGMSAEKEWWLRALAVFQSPSAVFAALRDDSKPQADARQEPVLALILLGGMAGVLTTPTAAGLLDGREFDGLLVGVFVFLAGALYGVATYWIGGGALHLGVRAAGAASSYRQARHVLAFAAAPLVLLLLVVWPLRLAVHGGDVFRSGGADDGGPTRWVFTALELGVFGWAASLLVLGVRAIHGWPLVRSLGGIVLALLALILLGLLFSAF